MSQHEHQKQCQLDLECESIFLICNQLTSICNHKSPFPPNTYEIIGLILLTCLAAVSNVGGGGAGGLAITATILFFGVTTKEGIAIDNISGLLLGVARFIQTLDEKHPQKNSVIVDYNLAVVSAPAILVASHIGATLNHILPTIVITIGASLCLAYLPIDGVIK